MIDSHRQIYSLRIYEEAVGELRDISLQDEFLLAQIGKVKLALPAYMLDSVKPLLGQRIAILRTDIKDKAYLIRPLPSDIAPANQMASLSAPIREVLS